MGDTISMFDKVCEVQSDKATVDISSKYDGVVNELHYQVGDMARVGSPLMTMTVSGGEDGAAADDTSESSAPEIPAVDRAISSSKSSNKALATPAVRRVAREYDIDISKIAGTGKSGRVLKEDVLRAGGAISSPAPSKPASTAGAEPTVSSEQSASARDQDETVPLRGYNRIMAKTMTEALKIPHFMLCDEVQADAMISLRSELKPIAEARGIKFTYMPLMLKAASLAMQRYPYINSSISDDLSSVTLYARHNIGFACATDAGLVVPTVHDCQEKSVFDIARDIDRLINLARDNKLAAEDVTGTTFTLSNIGSIGGIYGGPVITPPQVAIGAVGKLRTVPRYRDDGSVHPTSIFNISWSGDHRVVDGATMTYFSNAWIDYLQKPQLMICELK